jgi:hypothetical protein
MRDNRLVQWLVQGFSVLAFLILIMYLSSYLPQDGFLGSVRRVISMGR